MSWENLKDAYRTRLGNLTAKSVLVLIVDEANAEGMAFAGLDRVSALTEVNKRTTLRIIQVFGEIDLVNRTEATLKGRMVPAFQVNLAKLGLDLSAPFREAYAVACGKCHSDTPASVAVTGKSVAVTRASVAVTQPPHPLKGGSPVLPFLSPTPQPPQAGAMRPDPVELAVDQVCSALAIANRRKRRLLRDVIALEAEKGDAPATVALRMIAAWNAQAKRSEELRVKFGLVKFFGEGVWKDQRRWHWDEELLRQRAQAGVGS